MPEKNRQSNIELLRILAIMGVVVLHINNPALGGGLSYVHHGSVNYYILYALESLFMCAVDVFMIISGYFMCDRRKADLWKPMELVIQVILVNEAVYICRINITHGNMSSATILRNLIPANYFVILYCTVFIVSPFLNVLVGSLSEKGFRNMMVVLILLFSVYPTLVDIMGEIEGNAVIGLSSIGAYGSQWGYTFVNFAMMYIVGAYLKTCRPKLKDAGTVALTAMLVLCVIVLIIWARINDMTGFLTERTAWDYCNPVVILEAVIVVILFTRVNIGSVRIINTIAKACFTVFLLHPTLMPFVPVEKIVIGSPAMMLLQITAYVIAIFAVSWTFWLLYSAATRPVFRFLRKRIHLPIIDADSIQGNTE